MDTDNFLSHNSMSCPQCGAKQAAESQAFCQACRFPLMVVGGRFRLRKRLAAGGFGVVYLGFDLQERQDVAVKVLRAELSDDLQVRRHFVREIKLTTQLSEGNEHIVQILGHGEETGLGLFYAMEYLQGQSLREWLNQDAPLPFHQIFRIFGQLCYAVQAAHSQAIIHRDLKPANIFLVEHQGDPTHVKVLDFGLAKSIATSMMSADTQGTFGTLHYMAPEQVLQQHVGASADIYTLGVILYELVTRTRLFGDANVPAGTLGHLHVYQNPEPLHSRRPDVHYPEFLDWALRKALQKDPKQRYPSVESFWQRLEAWKDWPGVVDVLDHAEHTASVELPALSSSPSWASGSLPPSFSQSYHVPRANEEQEPTLSANGRGRLLGVVALGVLLGFVAFFVYVWQHVGRTSTSSGVSSRTQPVVAPVRSGSRDGGTGLTLLHRERPDVRASSVPEASPQTTEPPVRQRPLRSRPSAPPTRRRIRRKRRKRRLLRRRRRRVVVRRRSQRLHPCGSLSSKQRWVLGVCLRPACKKLTISFASCASCRARRRGSSFCLKVPRQGEVKVKVKADGYHPCSHSIATRARKLRWKLRPFTMDMLFGQNYSCMQTLR
ncbi:MAG: serine/threonine protein kinase [Deltaproteobacteria bacterium]|nr:MAG: serine/threonine protein kinase [Deltaproteobacteria bacterium]